MVGCCLSRRNSFNDELAFMAALNESATFMNISLPGEINGQDG